MILLYKNNLNHIEINAKGFICDNNCEKCKNKNGECACYEPEGDILIKTFFRLKSETDRRNFALLNLRNVNYGNYYIMEEYLKGNVKIV
jgi:hypothetical protein